MARWRELHSQRLGKNTPILNQEEDQALNCRGSKWPKTPKENRIWRVELRLVPYIKKYSITLTIFTVSGMIFKEIDLGIKVIYDLLLRIDYSLLF